MTNIVQHKRSSTAGQVPASLANAELAVNVADKKLYSSDGTNVFELTTRPGGAQYDIQINDGSGNFFGTSSATGLLQYDPTLGGGIMTVGRTINTEVVNASDGINVVTLRVIPGFSSATGEAYLPPPSNIFIPGGTAGQVLVSTGTAGSDALAWANISATPAGSNTQIQFNQNGVLGAGSGLRYDYANLEFFAANSNLFGITKVDDLRVSTTANLGANGNITITGSTTAGHLLINNGSNGVNWGFTNQIANGTSNVRIDATNGNVLVGANGQSNVVVISSTGTVATTTISNNVFITGYANVAGNVSAYGLRDIRWGTESIGINTTAPTGIVTQEVLANSIVYYTTAATAPITLSVRGNATLTLNSLMSITQSLTTTALITTGASPFGITALQVDGSAQTIRWSGGAAPTAVASSIMAYTFTIIKTAASTYTVLGTGTRYA